MPNEHGRSLSVRFGRTECSSPFDRPFEQLSLSAGDHRSDWGEWCAVYRQGRPMHMGCVQSIGLPLITDAALGRARHPLLTRSRFHFDCNLTATEMKQPDHGHLVGSEIPVNHWVPIAPRTIKREGYGFESLQGHREIKVPQTDLLLSAEPANARLLSAGSHPRGRSLRAPW